MKRFLALAAAAAMCTPLSALADVCLLTAVNSTCTFATDTSGGTVLYRNPENVFNLGSGGINPFLGLQKNGTEFGVSTDSPVVNTLPLDTKRDNVNTFTNTFTQNSLGATVENGVAYFTFLLDINEPNGGGQNLLSLDTLRIWDAQSIAAQLLTSTEVPTFGTLDTLFSALVYALGPGNTLVLDYDLFNGSGKGWDMEMLVPVSLFAGVGLDSRIIFGTGMGAMYAGQDGFEEWAYKAGTPRELPEPGGLALAGLGLIALGISNKRRRWSL